MRIVFAGTPEFAVPSLHALIDAGHEVVGVITREDAPLGRKRVLTPSPVAVAAEALGIAVHKANRLGAHTDAWVAERDARLGVIVAYGGLIREPLLSMPPLGWINLHFSDLPRWRGAAPVQRALMAGEHELGVTVFRLVEALDAGAVLTRDAHTFAPGTTAGEALTTLANAGTKALCAAVDALAADAHAGVAQSGPDSYAHKLSRDDGRIDLSGTATRALATWSGVTPEPGAFAMLGDQAIKLIELREAREAMTDERHAPGTVRFVGKRVLMDCADDVLELVRVQPAGKPAMDAAAWLRGRGGEAELS